MVDVMKELADLNTKLQQHQEMDKDLLHQASAEVAMLRAQLELYASLHLEQRFNNLRFFPPRSSAKEGGHPRVSSDSEQPRESIVSEIERRVAQDMQLQARQAELSSRSEQLQRMQQTLPPGKRSNANRLSMPDVEHLMQQNGVKSLPTSETSTPTVPSAVFEFKQENTSSLPALPPKVPKAPGNSNSIRARAIMGSLLDRPKRRVSSKNTTTTTTSTIALSGNSNISNDTRRRSQSVHLSSPSTIRDALKVVRINTFLSIFLLMGLRSRFLPTTLRSSALRSLSRFRLRPHPPLDRPRRRVPPPRPCLTAAVANSFH